MARVRRVGALGPETANAKETIDQLAAAFSEAGVEAESVSAVAVGERAILMIDVGEGSVNEIVRFLGGMLASQLDEPVVGLIGNHSFTHRLNVALDAAGHGTNLMLPDEIIWVVPESLEQTMRELDSSFPNLAGATAQEGTTTEDSTEEPSSDESSPAEGDDSERPE